MAIALRDAFRVERPSTHRHTGGVPAAVAGLIATAFLVSSIAHGAEPGSRKSLLCAVRCPGQSIHVPDVESCGECLAEAAAARCPDGHRAVPHCATRERQDPSTGRCPNVGALLDAVPSELSTRTHAQILACISRPDRHGAQAEIRLCATPPPCDAEDCRAYAACAEAPRGKGCAVEARVARFEWIGPAVLEATVDARLRGIARLRGRRCTLDGFIDGARLVVEVAHRLEPPALDLDLARIHLDEVKFAGQGCPPEVLALIEDPLREALEAALRAEVAAALRGLGATCDPELPAP